MRTFALVSIWIVRISGSLQLLLGALFWTGRAYGLLPVHIVNGVVIVLTLWALAVLTLIRGGRRGLASFGLVWGLVLPAFGLIQATVVVGSLHWIVRIAHLVMGLIAMGAAGTLGQGLLVAVRAQTSFAPEDVVRRPLARDVSGALIAEGRQVDARE